MASTTLCARFLPRGGQPARLTLSPGAVLSLRPAAGGTRVEVEAGIAWITRAGDRRDYVVEPGQEFHAAMAGEALLVEALGGAELRLRLSPGGAGYEE